MAVQALTEPPEPRPPTVCPKCGKPAWAPYVMKITAKSAVEIVNGEGVLKTYSYLVYRHPDGRRRTPRKCTVKVD